MLTIAAQSQITSGAGTYYERRRLFFFVCDADGERIFETDAAGTLADMGNAGGLIQAQDIAQLRSVRACIEFCGGRDFEISPAITDEIARQRSDDVNSMLRS